MNLVERMYLESMLGIEQQGKEQGNVENEEEQVSNQLPIAKLEDDALPKHIVAEHERIIRSNLLENLWHALDREDSAGEEQKDACKADGC